MAYANIFKREILKDLYLFIEKQQSKYFR